MKQHMARQKEELDARNAALKLGQRPTSGRPAPSAAEPARPVIQRATNLKDLAGVWTAARNYLANNARMLENVLGQCTRVDSLNLETSEVHLVIPTWHERFTGEKARAKLEEALRAVTGLTLRLHIQFVEMAMEAPPGTAGPAGETPSGGGMAAQRVPPELLEAVKSQPIIKELMRRLDATVTQVEMITGAEPESPHS